MMDDLLTKVAVFLKDVAENVPGVNDDDELSDLIARVEGAIEMQTLFDGVPHNLRHAYGAYTGAMVFMSDRVENVNTMTPVFVRYDNGIQEWRSLSAMLGPRFTYRGTR